MNLTLALLLAPLAAGSIAALWLFWKEREPRLAIAGLLLPALAVRHGLSPTPVAESMSELVSSPYASGLALEFGINFLAAASVVLLARSLRERNRAELVQWESMEAVRTLAEVLERRRGALEEGLRDLLELGCQHLGLEIGVHARIEQQHYSVIAVHAVDSSPVKPGDVLELDETFCQKTVESEGAIGIERVSGTHWAPHPGHARTGFEAYLGVPVSSGGVVVGTLYFASREARARRFTGVEKQLLLLMADWLGGEIERESLALAAATRANAPETLASRPEHGGARLVPRRGETLDRRRLDVNAAVAQLRDEMQRELPPERELRLSLDAADPIARLYRHEFDRVLWSLFWHALELPVERGALRLATEAIIPPGEADPAGLHFVLLTLSVGPPGLDATGLEALFEDRARDAPIATRHGCLSLPRIERLLRAVGGDLSIHSDSAGTTLTAYLPLSPTTAEAGAEPA